MIRKFTKEIARSLAQEMKDHLAGFASKRGLTVEYRGGTFDAGYFKPRIEFSVIENESGKSRDQENFEAWCASFGLKADDHGKMFKAGGKTYKLVGIDIGRRRFPIVAVENGTERRVFFKAEVTKRLMEPCEGGAC